MYQPIKKSLQMNTPATHQKPVYQTVNGRDMKSFAPVGTLMGHFKQKSGNEVEINGLKVVNKNITYTCWYNPKLEEKDRLIILGRVYEVTDVENVEMRNRYMTCSLVYVGAGA